MSSDGTESDHEAMGVLVANLAFGVPADRLGLTGPIETVCIGCGEPDADHIRGCLVAAAYFALGGEEDWGRDALGPCWSSKKAKPVAIWDGGAWEKRMRKWRPR